MKSLRIKKSEAIYLFCYIIFIISMFVLAQVRPSTRGLWLVCPIITLGILSAMIFKGTLPVKNILAYIGIVTVFSVASIRSNRPYIMVYAVLLCCAELTTFERILKTSAVTSIVVILIVFTLSAVGVIPNRVFYRADGSISRSFGFAYYHVVPYTFFYLVMDYLYLRKNRIKIYNLVIILVINLLLYKTTGLRLIYYLNYITVLLFLILVNFDLFSLKKKVATRISMMIFPAFFALTIWINWIYTPSNLTLMYLNRMLSGRLYLGHEAFNRYSLKLFGQIIRTVSGGWDVYFYIDSGFLYALLGYGIIFTIVALAMYMYLYVYSSLNNDKVLFIWLTGVAIFSFSNNTWIDLYMNPILLLLPFIMGKNRKMRSRHVLKS